MTTPQAVINARRRAENVAGGKCRDCGTEADGVPTVRSAGRSRRLGNGNGGRKNDEHAYGPRHP